MLRASFSPAPEDKQKLKNIHKPMHILHIYIGSVCILSHNIYAEDLLFSRPRVCDRRIVESDLSGPRAAHNNGFSKVTWKEI